MKSTLILLASIATLAVAKFETWPSGLQVEYISVPETCDIKPLNGELVLLHYTGALEDGTKFESDRTEIFQVGTKGTDPRRTWKGVEEAVLDMCIGEKRRLIVPPELGSGECDYTLNEMSGYTGIDALDNNSIIPGGSTLYYDIELIATKYLQAADPNLFKTIDTNGDSNLSKEEMSIFFYEDKRVEEIFSIKDKDKGPKDG